jgi:hypothetical protein
MSEDKKTGSCLCGEVSYSFNESSVISAHHCHCKDCQKSTGSGKATIIMIPENALQMKGEIKIYTVTGTDGSHVTRGFCESCGSPLISYIEEMQGIRLIKAGSLDDSSWLKIDSNFWSSTAREWSPVDETLHSFIKNPQT